jgi:hypothetical protein
MKYVVWAGLAAAVCCFAEQSPEPAANAKPDCNAVNRGKLWPQVANSSPEAGLELFERGELEKCSRVKTTFGSKYKWERLSVNAHDLVKQKQTKQRSSN